MNRHQRRFVQKHFGVSLRRPPRRGGAGGPVEPTFPTKIAANTTGISWFAGDRPFTNMLKYGCWQRSAAGSPFETEAAYVTPGGEWIALRPGETAFMIIAPPVTAVSKGMLSWTGGLLSSINVSPKVSIDGANGASVTNIVKATRVGAGPGGLDLHTITWDHVYNIVNGAPSGGNVWAQVNIGVVNPADPPRNMFAAEIDPLTGEYLTTALFHPRHIAHASDFNAMRFLEWAAANQLPDICTKVTWANRARFDKLFPTNLGTTAASITVGAGNAGVTFTANSFVPFDGDPGIATYWIARKAAGLSADDSEFLGIGAHGNRIRIVVLAPSGAGSFVVDNSVVDPIVTITPPAAGTATALKALFDSLSSSSAARIILSSCSLVGNGSGAVPTLAQTNMSGGRDAQCLGWLDVETLVAYANAANVDPHFHFPIGASDDYVSNFAAYVAANLNPWLVPTFEVGNEPWNQGFSATRPALASAAMRDTFGFRTLGESVLVLSQARHAELGVRFAALVAAQMGGRTHHWYLNGQQGGGGPTGALTKLFAVPAVAAAYDSGGTAPYIDAEILNRSDISGLEWASGGTYAVGTARYRTTGASPNTWFTCIQAHTGRATAPEADGAYWARSTAGNTKATRLASVTDRMAVFQTDYTRIAVTLGKRFVCYEGGNHDRSADTTFANDIQTADETYEVFNYYYGEQRRIAGANHTLMQLAFVGPVTNPNHWGARRHIDEPLATAPKYRKLLDAKAGKFAPYFRGSAPTISGVPMARQPVTFTRATSAYASRSMIQPYVDGVPYGAPLDCTNGPQQVIFPDSEVGKTVTAIETLSNGHNLGTPTATSAAFGPLAAFSIVMIRKAGDPAPVVPAGVTKCDVFLLGPGGNGASTTNGGSAYRNTGGSGSYSQKLDIPVTPGDVIPIQIGTKGSVLTTWAFSALTVLANPGTNATNANGGRGLGGAAGVGDLTRAGTDGINNIQFRAAAGAPGAPGPDGPGALGTVSPNSQLGGAGGGPNNGFVGVTTNNASFGGNNRFNLGGGRGARANPLLALQGTDGGAGGPGGVTAWGAGVPNAADSSYEPIWTDNSGGLRHGETIGPGSGGSGHGQEGAGVSSGNASYGGGGAGFTTGQGGGFGGDGFIVFKFKP